MNDKDPAPRIFASALIDRVRAGLLRSDRHRGNAHVYAVSDVWIRGYCDSYAGRLLCLLPDFPGTTRLAPAGMGAGVWFDRCAAPRHASLCARLGLDRAGEWLRLSLLVPHL